MIKTIDNFLTDEECDKFIIDIENKKNIKRFNIYTEAKNDHYIDIELSNYFYEKIINNRVVIDDVVGVGEVICTMKYSEGTNFGLHKDLGFYYKNGNASYYTVLIYLNDNFDKGETIFYKNNEEIHIIPKKGRCLIFDMCNMHKGNIVKNGTKYWIGCELIAPIRPI